MEEQEQITYTHHTEALTRLEDLIGRFLHTNQPTSHNWESKLVSFRNGADPIWCQTELVTVQVGVN
jgi:hypothetical protein